MADAQTITSEAGVAQSAEAADLNSAQCGFESRRPHSMKIPTEVGFCSIRKKGKRWYARLQRGRRKYHISLNTADLYEAVATAKELVPQAVLGRHQIIESSALLPDDQYFRAIFNRARARAKREGTEFSLAMEDIDTIVKRCLGRCELTGITFSLLRITSAFRAPFAPSLDRVDSTRGYIPGNCRLVCVAVNWALSDWGVGVFDAVCLAYAARKISTMTGSAIVQEFYK